MVLPDTYFTLENPEKRGPDGNEGPWDVSLYPSLINFVEYRVEVPPAIYLETGLETLYLKFFEIMNDGL